MRILFEVISTPVRNDTTVEHMNFTHSPGIEPRFWEQIFQKRIPAHLNIAGPEP